MSFGGFCIWLRELATLTIASAAQWTFLHSPKALNLGTHDDHLGTVSNAPSAVINASA
jgi:hypothetical protein